ncbi:MAG TPA: glycosyltransferase family 2 protein [Abditibacteriaceae bacterium]|jgi:glycosyltransferase involved in cell wall biosynthesis
MKVTLSLLAYNEEEVIERVTRDAVEHLAAVFAPGDWELLIINDGSRDNTGALCDELSTQIEGVRVYHHNPNRGYVEATLSAMREARGDYICVFDGDGQQTAADVPRIVQKLESGCDAVFGWKKERHDGTTRHTLSWGLRMMARFFLHSRLHDINAGCRGFRKEHVEKLAVIKHRINFIGPELYTRARLHNLKICEIAVRHAPRESGASSHPWKKIPREVWQVLNYLQSLRGELRAAGKWRRYLP